MSVSQARVLTDRPSRYGKQLAAHMGRKIQADWSEESGRGELVFTAGTATLTAEEGALLLVVEGAEESLPQLEDVVGRHLVRFGTRDELVVAWQREGGVAGTVQRNDAPDE
ncbi:DUF2218 domain-containing protein [Kitasatospora sp. NPDC051853]|uniref:DUF2218 domain-containing protein n=1 Tax=Kitasatospora sp. NPDC051853 TaxID=3364058 RepID=UPI00379B9CB0